MLENHVLGTHDGPLTDEGYGVQLVAVCVGQAGFWSIQRAAFGQIAGRQFDDKQFCTPSQARLHSQRVAPWEGVGP